MMLAQAAGRLIRTASDRGVVAVLDRRLGTASYRWDIVNALPRCAAPATAPRLRRSSPRSSRECENTQRLTAAVSHFRRRARRGANIGTVNELVHLDIDGGIATITLDSPANRNALSRQLVADLHVALDGAEAGIPTAPCGPSCSPIRRRRSAPAPI